LHDAADSFGPNMQRGMEEALQEEGSKQRDRVALAVMLNLI